MTDTIESIHDSDIDSSIAICQDRLSTSPRPHPHRPALVLGLGVFRFDRYMLSKQKEDLDKSILNLTESTLLSPISWPPEHAPSILKVFYKLALALLLRSQTYKQTEDVTCATNYLRHLRNQPHEAFDFRRHEATTFLVHALAVQVDLEAGNMVENLEEMVALCRELLTSNTSESDASGSFAAFAGAVVSGVCGEVENLPLDQMIECLRGLRTREPDLRQISWALLLSLYARYEVTFVDDDRKEATSIFDEVVAVGDPEESNLVARVSYVIARIAAIRSVAHNTPENSEEAMYRARSFLSTFSDERPQPFDTTTSLRHNAQQRFRYFDSIEGINQDVTPLSQRAGASEYNPRDAQAVADLELLKKLLSGIVNKDITNVEEAVNDGRSILPSFDPSDRMAFFFFQTFGEILFEAFQRTAKVEYLNESITTYRHALKYPLAQYFHLDVLGRLAQSFFARFSFFKDPHHVQDLDEAVKLLSQCANDRRATLSRRFEFACLWAHFARNYYHPTISTAYKTAMSLMQDALLFAPTLQLQHTTLVASFEKAQRLPLDFSSYQIQSGQLKEAIETLERGRALLWSEMRDLRTSIDQFQQDGSHLGQRFAAVTRDLEDITKSIAPGLDLNMDDGGAENVRAVDPFGRLLLKQRSLLEERDKLIAEIQALPGFGTFGATPSFDILRSAASHGPVILINHSEWRSDILVLLHNTSPSLIPTPDDFYVRAIRLRDELIDARNKHGIQSDDYEQTLAAVLAGLYNLVGKPVIDKLRELNVPKHSRIWWCPTSVFCSLPLHAMGPIPSDDGENLYFLDFYICSYTPTLSALIQSRNRHLSSQSLGRPSLLLVARPDSIPTVVDEIQVVQALGTEVTSLISETASPAAVVDGFQRHKFAHFACHGTLEPGKPFDAGFELYGGKRLTLLEIVRSHLPDAEFAFLSACHTAEATEGSIMDEGLHLAAAAQYCGFRSVVGTMWAMADMDGQDLAKDFYKSMFRRRQKGETVPYYERSAEALRDAVRKLRRKRWITLERWVNFVHYGA